MKKKEIKVSVVIPNYNGVHFFKKNLPYVIKASRIQKNRIKEIIIIDDASQDKSVKYLKENFPQIRLIQHRKNRGFPTSVNTGFRSAKGNIIALLNTDVVVSKDFVYPTLAHFAKDNVFGVSLHEKGYSWAKGMFKDGFIEHKQGKKARQTHETFWVSGGSGVFRRDYWIKMGGFDEKLLTPFYWEDVDIGYRAWKRGLVCLWEPKAKVIHEHEGTMGKIPKGYKGRIQERNQLLVIWKNITSSRLIKKHFKGLALRTLKHPGYIRVVVMALLKVRIVFKRRRKEKKEAKVADEAVFARF